MSSSDKNRLLNETLRESRQYEAFRNAIFQAGLTELRKTRPTARSWTPWALAASLLVGIGVGIWGMTRKSEHPQVVIASSVDSFVSRPLSAGDVVRSTADDRLLVQTERAHGAVEVVTTEHVPLTELDDRELLSVFGKKPAGFVQNNGHLQFMVLGN
jgi:hypothetical protein